MRIGFVGPGLDAREPLERALALLLADPEVRHVLYLGNDDAADEVVSEWAARAQLHEEALLTRGLELACSGTADELSALLAQDREARRPAAVRRLPAQPARAIEMFDRFIVLCVHDKAVLDEDDIASAHVIVYGHSEGSSLRRFGPRAFFTPGPVRRGHVGCLTLLPTGRCEITVLDLEGNTVSRDQLEVPGAKVVVSS